MNEETVKHLWCFLLLLQTKLYNQFKLETLQLILKLTTAGCFMVSLDLKDAYYVFPINPDYTKYLKFSWKGELYRFLVCLSSRPRKFTKLMKPPIATLRINGCIVAIYTHDLINVGATFQEIADNVMASVELLDSRSSRPEVFCKKGALKNFTTFTGKYLCQILFFNKVAGLRPATLLKRVSGTGVSRKFCEIFKNTYFCRTPPVAAFEILWLDLDIDSFRFHLINIVLHAKTKYYLFRV